MAVKAKRAIPSRIPVSAAGAQQVHQVGLPGHGPFLVSACDPRKLPARLSEVELAGLRLTGEHPPTPKSDSSSPDTARGRATMPAPTAVVTRLATPPAVLHPLPPQPLIVGRSASASVPLPFAPPLAGCAGRSGRRASSSPPSGCPFSAAAAFGISSALGGCRAALRRTLRGKDSVGAL